MAALMGAMHAHMLNRLEPQARPTQCMPQSGAQSGGTGGQVRVFLMSSANFKVHILSVSVKAMGHVHRYGEAALSAVEDKMGGLRAKSARKA